MNMTAHEERRTSPRSSSLRSSHRSSTTRSSTFTADLESLRLSLTSEADPTLQPASAWNPIASIQSSGFFGFGDELELSDGEAGDNEPRVDDAGDDNDARDSRDNKGRGLDPPEHIGQCALVPWRELQDNDDGGRSLKKADGSSATEALSSSCDEEDDVEPCEEHYRVPPAKEEVLLDAIVCRSDPPDVHVPSSSAEKSKQELIQRINAQLALVPSSKYNGYKHHFITVKEQHRFLLLYNFLKRNLDSKIIVYFSTTKSTQYHGRLLNQLQFNVKYVHGRQSKEKFLDIYLSFSKQKCGILCLPDTLQGMNGSGGSQNRDLSIPPSVSHILQYEPPHDPTEYIFRVSRISSERSSKHRGKALIFVTPHQLFPILKYFKAAHVNCVEYEMHNLNHVQRHYEKLVRSNKELQLYGKEAYHEYLLNYASHEYRDVYDVHQFDKDAVAKSFGFAKAPSGGGGGGGGGSRNGLDIKEEETRRQEDNTAANNNRLLWKPNKKDKDSWINREDRLWRHADRHSHLIVKKDRIR
jgi:ATP-dependent RNA helicase DDX18/HAS1